MYLPTESMVLRGDERWKSLGVELRIGDEVVDELVWRRLLRLMSGLTARLRAAARICTQMGRIVTGRTARNRQRQRIFIGRLEEAADSSGK